MLMLVVKMQKEVNISTRRLVLETAVKKLSPGAQKPGIVVSMILLAPALQMSKTLRARMWEKMCGGRNHNKALDADKNLKNEHMGKVSGAKNRNQDLLSGVRKSARLTAAPTSYRCQLSWG